MGSVSSDSSRGPPTPVDFSTSRPTHRDRPRDSLQSGTSSSLYPPSTHTSSPLDRALSPQSHFEQMPGVVEVPTLAENESGYRDFDTDDVSLRLQLLVNNRYFLPPAHYKPTVADLSNSDAAKRTPKPATPGFFDIFRIGKAKSKPTTPVTAEPPRLRATSESSTQINLLHYTDPPGASTTPQKPAEIPARVMVVREKMEDLLIAAKKVEQESKIRAERLAELQEHNLDQTERFDGIIDPTDAVDLPPPSTKYPFTIQASVAQGLGVNDSIGAAFLADRLPPPRSPGLWSVTEEDEKWRKLLLTQAVGHSLSNTPESWASRTPGRRPPRTNSIPTTTPRSPLSPTPQSPPSPTPQAQTLFSEPILLPDALQKRLQHIPSLSRLTPSQKPQALHLDRKSPTPDITNLPSPLSPLLRSSYDPPVRAETPVPPTFPLSPAPRTIMMGPGSPGMKQLVNPIYSLSQSDLGDAEETRVGISLNSPAPTVGNDQTHGPSVQEILSGQREREELQTVQSILAQAAQTAQSTRSMKSARSVRSLRQTIESERLPDAQEGDVDAGSGRTLTSPPPADPCVTIEPVVISPRHTLGAESEAGTNSQFEEEDTEEWFGLHDDSGSRDSSGPYPRTRSMLSYLAPPSPTVSAFYDALEGRRDSDSSPAGPDTDVGTSSGPETFVTADTRASGICSPPPRQSTCISPQPLPPPPRRPRTDPVPRRPSTLRQEPITIWEPEPSTPPLPSLSGERRGTGFSLDIPRLPERGELSRAVAEEAAQGDAARMSISFFDNIQSDLNELDGSSSSEEESETESDLGEPVEAPVFRNPDTQAISIPGRRSTSSTTTRPARPTLMRLGNNSTPQLGSSTSSGSSFNQIRHDYPLFDPASFGRPIGDAPITPSTKSSFFASRTAKKQKQGVSSEDYHGPKARSFEDGAGPSTSNGGSTFLDMESGGESSDSGHESQETGETGKSHGESTRILDGLVLQHLEKERDTIKRITESNRAAKSRP